MLNATVGGATAMEHRRGGRRRSTIMPAGHHMQYTEGVKGHSESPTKKEPPKDASPSPEKEIDHAEDNAPPSQFNVFRSLLWKTMDDPSSSSLAMTISVLIIVLILLSTITFIIETVSWVREAPGAATALRVIEIICIAIFTAEILLRVFSCPSLSGFFRDWFNWIDLLAVVPFYLEFALPDAAGASSLGVVRAIRLVRVVRVFKVSRYSQSIRVFASAMIASFRSLTMLFFLVSIAVVLFSSAMYYAEFTEDGCIENGWKDVAGVTADFGQYTCFETGEDGWKRVGDVLSGSFRYTPTKQLRERVARMRGVNASSVPTSFDLNCACLEPNPFTDIPTTFWWCIVTLTTVGYGDEVPVTGLGKFVAVVTMFSGVIILALPITVIGTNFTRVLREIQQERIASELEAIDKDGDGLVDIEELKMMIENMVAAAGDLPKDLVPDAEALLKRYDEDASGQLDPEEVEKLKVDIRKIMGLSSAEDDPPAAAIPSPSTSTTRSGSMHGGAHGSFASEPPAPATKTPTTPTTPATTTKIKEHPVDVEGKSTTATATAATGIGAGVGAGVGAGAGAPTTITTLPTPKPLPSSNHNRAPPPPPPRDRESKTRDDEEGAGVGGGKEDGHEKATVEMVDMKKDETPLAHESSTTLEGKKDDGRGGASKSDAPFPGLRKRFQASGSGAAGGSGGGSGGRGGSAAAAFERRLEAGSTSSGEPVDYNAVLVDTILKTEERIDRKLVTVANMLDSVHKLLSGGPEGAL